MNQIYLDYAATTPVREEVLKAMLPYFDKKFGNPGSINSFGSEALDAVDEARATIAKILNAKINEIIFTGSGTESVNLAIKGTARANKSKGKHISSPHLSKRTVIGSISKIVFPILLVRSRDAAIFILFITILISVIRSSYL